MKDDQDYREQIRLKAKNDFNQDLTESQIDMCIYTEEQEKLSFFHGHLYINPRRMQVDGKWVNKVQWSKSIDGYRVLAQRNGLCRVDESVWQHDSDGNLFCCKVAVWRRGPDGYPEGPFIGIAHYHEFVQMVDDYENGRKTGKKRPNRQWQTSPMNQLSICAERQAHRKAGLDHTHVTDDIVDIQPRETIDEPVDAEEVEDHEDSVPEPAAEPAPVAPAPTLEYSKSHRGSQYRGATIVMTVSGPTWHAILLDNGKKVVFGREGTTLTEQEVGDRDFEFAGGAEWLEGSAYYDGAKVVGVTTKGRNAVLELDSGFKVKLDQWGKEVGRKELEKPEPKPEPQSQADSDAAKDLPDDDGGAKGDTEFAKAMTFAEDCSGASVEELRKGMIALLAFWCKNMNGGVKISPRSAYIELVGVAIPEGDKMREEDYRALLETLHEKIQEKAA
jgi:hypothetical protein